MLIRSRLCSLRLMLCCALLLAAGCGARPVAPSSRSASLAAIGTSSALRSSSSVRSASLASPAPSGSSPSAAAASAGPAPTLALKLEVEQRLSVPVLSIALGEGSRLAVLADPPQVGDARGLHALPLPVGLRPKPGEVDEARIYFGRDNEPRIMGTRRSKAGESAIYWRHLPSGWRDGREEIGQLGGTTRGGLWGVLGGADPELVCRAKASCIIKRSSGWTIAPAGDAARIVTLQSGVLWGLDGTGVASIDARGWSLAIPAPAWSVPRAFWATRGEAWVSADDGLFRFHDGAWSAVAAPLLGVSACWGTRPDSVWLAGQGAVAHFDGREFRSAVISGSLRAIDGRSDSEVWLGGDAGLFRVRLLGP